MLIGITARARNGLMLKFRVDEAITQTEAARRADVPLGVWNSLELLRFNARFLSWRYVRRMADLIGCDAAALCPEALKDKDCRIGQVAYREVEAGRLLARQEAERLALPSPDKQLEIKELAALSKERLAIVLKGLTYRQREILKLRYGLNGAEPMTLAQIGKVFKVTRDRVRQVECGAIRKLQAPAVAEFLSECLNDP